MVWGRCDTLRGLADTEMSSAKPSISLGFLLAGVLGLAYGWHAGWFGDKVWFGDKPVPVTTDLPMLSPMLTAEKLPAAVFEPLGKPLDVPAPVSQMEQITAPAVPSVPVAPAPAAVPPPLQQQLVPLLAAVQAGDGLALRPHLAALSQCAKCLAMLKSQLLAVEGERSGLAALATALTAENNPVLARLLVSVAQESMQAADGAIWRSDVLLAAIANYDSPELAELFAKLLLDAEAYGQPLPDELGAALVSNINQASDRGQVAERLSIRYWQDTSPEGRARILAFQHPETLGRISTMALAQADAETYQVALTALQASSDLHAFDVFVQLHAEAAYAEQAQQVLESARLWSAQYADSEALDWMEQPLFNTGLSRAEYALILDLVRHSPEQGKAAKIMAAHAVN